MAKLCCSNSNLDLILKTDNTDMLKYFKDRLDDLKGQCQRNKRKIEEKHK